MFPLSSLDMEEIKIETCFFFFRRLPPQWRPHTHHTTRRRFVADDPEMPWFQAKPIVTFLRYKDITEKKNVKLECKLAFEDGFTS